MYEVIDSLYWNEHCFYYRTALNPVSHLLVFFFFNVSAHWKLQQIILYFLETLLHVKKKKKKGKMKLITSPDVLTTYSWEFLRTKGKSGHQALNDVFHYLY